MATEKKNESATPENQDVNPEKKLGTPEAARANDSDQQARQIADLQSLTNSLIDTVKKVQQQQTRDLSYFDALSDIKSATKALLMSQPAPALAGADTPVAAKKEGCSDARECISNECCRYDIMLSQIRVTSMQNEPGDSNLGVMEIRLFAHLNGIGAVVPGMFSTLTLHKPIGNPALWTTVNAKVASVTVPHNFHKDFLVTIDAEEVENTQLENALYQRDEHGSNNGTLTLTCCCKPPVITIEVPFTAGGLGAGNRGSIEVRLTAVKTSN